MSDTWTERLSEYIDGTLSESERTALEAHLASCAACATTLDELRRVVTRARALDDRLPATDHWPRIAAGIGLAGAPRGAGVELAYRRPRRRFSFTVPQALAASLALALLSGAASWLLRPRVASQRQVGSAPQPAQWLTAADRRYEVTVAELEGVLAEGRRTGRLDSATVRILERSLATIDTAIAEARRALAADPGSAYLNYHLADTMRRKVELLRRATALAGTQT
jgi:anti-sigma factor RsiW